MPLATYKGGLIVKDGKLCTTCCGTPVVGKCCQYKYNSSGAQPANTAEEAIELASQSASANSAAIPNSIWTVGTPAGVPWVEGEAWYDAERNQYECEGYWTTGGYICSEETNSWCSSKPFTYFYPGDTCVGEPQCPQYPPDSNPTGACCYFYSASSDESYTKEWRCLDGITEQDCLMNGQNQTFYPGKTCDEIECPPPDPDPDPDPDPSDIGRCCVYTGQQFTQGCGDTREECIADAQSEAGSVENGYFDENDITFDPDPDADCPYSVAVYEYLPEADTPVCWDEDEDGNPVTRGFCDALKTPDVFKAEFTKDEDCGGDNNGSGTCQSTPNRSNPLP